MILVKTWNFLFVFVLDKMGLEVMFDDHVVKQQAHLDQKIVILHSCHIILRLFLKEVTLDFGQKLEISLLFLFLFFFSQNKCKKNNS